MQAERQDETGRVALVTGAARRLGAAMAMRLAADGFRVAVHHRGSPEAVAETVAKIQGAGGTAMAVRADLEDIAAMDAMLASIRHAFGAAPEVLVNNASVFEWDDLASVTSEALLRHYRTNTVAAVLLTRRVTAAPPASGAGVIVNLLDQKLLAPNPDHLSYTLSKYALLGFTELMARALAPHWRVCGIAPGYTLPAPEAPPGHFERTRDDTPLRRGPTPEDVADTLSYIVSNRAVTGQVFAVDGGAFMAPASRDYSFR
ncbi:SDR family NAD(P)-dependent oxidoreductase [Marinibaculum pumilum]|uniref:SDR family NAD(P)-dependent oxidoreductase n=1 Tax=Marinibaculum pumilum TaxID=1766165 RepID=A0ABV7L1D9_9PROT